MAVSKSERALLPLIGLQGGLTAFGGFIGFHVMASGDANAIFRYTLCMLTSAIAGTVAGYLVGPLCRASSAVMLRAGFVLPGCILLFGDGSPDVLAAGYGAFIGMTWGARHLLEMSMFRDRERDAYASRSGALGVACGIAATILVTLLLAGTGAGTGMAFRGAGAIGILGGLMLGKRIPGDRMRALVNPLAVLKQPQFLASMPLFFLESGLFGVGQAVGSAGAFQALGSASTFGWVATLAGMAGAIALFLTRRWRDAGNRVAWLGRSCAVVAAAFVMLGMSAWSPVFYVLYAVLKAAGGPFLSASEQVLNQRTLDIQGALQDRIVAREVVLWMFRMTSLVLFWNLLSHLSAAHLLAAGAGLLAAATLLEYAAGRALLWRAARGDAEATRRGVA
ncbi:hypothetical protein [Noviherbaspirillum galbum]|uniref:MFS transporter n=1 Tax=Noviherbaspirillum galbum TaxID=2709383 RepID=A0A6B3STJ9_9BURK|nr:hypothetical protein [Noviherbaspirillum galbum]NEX64087.1 hypothetical protein [Noviherbaspirillum galbum]